MGTPGWNRLDDTHRQAILTDIRAGQLGRNAIARKHQVGLGTVSAIARENGLHDAFDRSRTARATADRRADLKARRAQLAEDLLDDAERIRDRLFDPYQTAVATKDGAVMVELAEPDAAALRNFATSIAVLLDKHVVLDRHDADGGIGEVGSMLGGLLEKFGLRRDSSTPPDCGEDQVDDDQQEGDQAPPPAAE